MLVIQNEKILDLIKYTYTLEELHRIVDLLEDKGTFNFYPLTTGLFSAAVTTKETQYTGYKYVWIRDNIYVAYAHYIVRKFDMTINCLSSLMKYFKSYRQRFERIIDTPSVANNVMERPHVKIDGENLREINEKWSHAQNDALGYFLWLYCKLFNEGLLKKVKKEDIEIVALFPLYFNAISYWKDEDSGHWEERRKIEASSIGVVKAGLEALRQTLIRSPNISDYLDYKGRLVTLDFLDELIQNGAKALREILPYECREPGLERKYDSALLFLVYPLKVVDGAAADRIVQDVISYLQGDYGIRRYIGDSFWAANYKKLPLEQRTADVSDDMSYRNSLIQEGQEAQWCIFDPIISVIFGFKFKETRHEKYLQQQIFYLNRSLGQLTGKECRAGEFKCPELYYLEDDKYIANDATPLLWTQANLMIALKEMEKSLL